MRNSLNYLFVLCLTASLVACNSGSKKEKEEVDPTTNSLLPTEITSPKPLTIDSLDSTTDIDFNKEGLINNALDIKTLKYFQCGQDEGSYEKKKTNVNFYKDEFVVRSVSIDSEHLDDFEEIRIAGNIENFCYRKYRLWNGFYDYYIGKARKQDESVKEEMSNILGWEEEIITGYKTTENFYYIIVDHIETSTEDVEGVEVNVKEVRNEVYEFTKDLKFSGSYVYNLVSLDHDIETLEPTPQGSILTEIARLSSAEYGEKVDYEKKQEFYDSLPEVANRNAIIRMHYYECDLEDGNITNLSEEKTASNVLALSRKDEEHSTGSTEFKTDNSSLNYIAIKDIQAGIQSTTIRGDTPGAQKYNFYDYTDMAFLKTLIPDGEEKTNEGTAYLVVPKGTKIGLRLTFKSFFVDSEPTLEKK